jgi:hypothetical protein
MHAHLTTRDRLPLHLAQGVTGARDMGSDLDRAKDWRRAIDKGDLLGPHIETCGPPFDGFPSEDASIPVTLVRSPSEARTFYGRLETEALILWASCLACRAMLTSRCRTGPKVLFAGCWSRSSDC